MKREIFFSNVNIVGDLFLDYIFFEFEMEPLLFTCVDKANRLYFCHCYKLLSEQKWFVVPISIDRLLSLIDGTDDIRGTILTSKKLLNITRDTTGKETSEWEVGTDIPQNDLPPFGTLLKCDKKEARLYITKKKDAMDDSQSIVLNYVINNDIITRSDKSDVTKINFEACNVLTINIVPMSLSYKNVSYKQEKSAFNLPSGKKMLYKKDSEEIIFYGLDFDDIYAA